MILKIVWKNIMSKKLNSFLCVLLMAFGICIISLISLLSKQIEEKFSKNISGIDMVVGAKGSPLQLILSAVYQIDAPTGNIDMAELQSITNNRLIKEVIPISMGDNYNGFRIVGTNQKYLKHFKAGFNAGKTFSESKEAVIGDQIARKLNLKIGQTIESSHGFDSQGEKHNDHKLKIVGILKPSISTLDHLILVDLQTVWDLHDDPHHGSQENENDTEKKQYITAALVKFRSPLGLITLPRNINQNTHMQAALPAIEINRLFELLGVGFDAVKWLAMSIVLISGISVFISLYNALKERKHEMALMLSMGAQRFKLFVMLLLEGLLLSVTGYIFGILFSRIGLYFASKALAGNLPSSLNNMTIEKEEIILLIAALLVGIFAAMLPSIGVYRIDISKTLAND
jgi:putative ABC transport system permease protein